MVGNLTHVGTLESLTNYHFKKIEEGVAEKLFSQGIDDNNKKSVNLSFKAISKLDDGMADPYVHLSLNFPIEDKDILTNQKMEEITKECLEKLGYGEQPKWVIRHHDQDHPHVHIITHSIKENGTKVSRNWEQYRLMDINRSLEKKYGLRIISSIKNEKNIEKSSRVELNKSADYKNYLTQSVKETMALKPRRFNDFQQILKEKYNISTFVTKKNNSSGVSFAVTDAVGGRYIEEKGTLAISGSDLSKKFSHPKLKESIQFYFNNASQNYGKLLSFQTRLKKELQVFETIKIEDFNNYSKTIEIVKNEKSGYIFIDKLSKNAFNSNDLKKFDFSKLGLETKIELSPELQGKIYTEAIFAYRSDMRAQGFTSSFVLNIYQKDNIFNYLESGKAYNEICSFLTENDKEAIKDFFVSQNNNLDAVVQGFQKQEEKQREFDKDTYYSFISGNNIAPVENLFNPKEPLPFQVQNTLRGIRNITEKINEKIEKEKGNKPSFEKKLPEYQVKVTKDLFFAHETLFKIEDLKGDHRNEMEKLINKEYGIDTKNRAFKTAIEPEKVLEYLNKHGVEIIENEGHLSAKINGYSQSFFLKELEQDFLRPLGEKIQTQNVETDKDLIQIRLAIEDQKWGIVNVDILPEVEKERLFKNEDWQNYTQDKEHHKLLNEALFIIIKEDRIDYKSTLLEKMAENKASYSEKISELVKDHSISDDKINQFIKNMTTPESIEKAKSTEIKNLEDHITRANVFENPAAILALQGYRNKEAGITEKTEKYTVETSLSVHDKLSHYVSQNKVYQFYSPLIKDMVGEITGKESRIILPDKVVLLEEIKGKISDVDFEKFKNVAETSYIKYFYNKVVEDDKILNKMEYLNSKGIRIENTEDTTSLRLINSITTVQVDIKVQIDDSIQKQILAFVGEGNNQKANLTFKISSNLESGNYRSIAFDLKREKLGMKDVFLTSVDAPHKEHMQKAIEEIQYNKPGLSLGDLAQSLLSTHKQQNRIKKPKMKKGKGRKM